MSTERENANAMLAQLGITQAIVTARQQALRAAGSKAIADSLDGTALGTTPGLHANPMDLAGPQPYYLQPDTGSPTAKPAGATTRKNPMGL